MSIRLAEAGHSTAHSQFPRASPAKAAVSDSTAHSVTGRRLTSIRAPGTETSKPTPGSGPGRPAYEQPRPMPGSSATRTRSAGPPSGAGPDSATATARAPDRSSPACANPVTSHPAGGGHGAQTGTLASRRTASRPPRPGRRGGHSGLTAPCAPHRQSLDQGLGGAIGPRQRGHAGPALMVTHGTSPRCGRSHRCPGLSTESRSSSAGRSRRWTIEVGSPPGREGDGGAPGRKGCADGRWRASGLGVRGSAPAIGTGRHSLRPGSQDRREGGAQAVGGSNSLVRRRPAARPLAATTRAIFRDASSIISSPSITAPRPWTRVA
jgi:hypothetical protein